MLNRSFLIGIFGTVLLAIPLLILNFHYDGQNIWAGLKLGNAGVFEEFCERNHMTAFTREKMNSWSNLAYAFFGFSCLGLWFYDRKKLSATKSFIVEYPVFSFLTGLSLIYLALGSFYYHASLTYFGQRLDMSGTYASMVAVIYIGLLTVIETGKSNGISNGWAWGFAGLVLATDIFFYIFKWSVNSKIVLPAMIILLIACVAYLYFIRMKQSRLILAIGALLSMILAFTLWILDVKKVLCDPDSILQGHAVWHVLTGLSIFLMYYFFRGYSLRE